MSIVLCIALMFVFHGTLATAGAIRTTQRSDEPMVSKLTRELEIPPASDYFIRFDSTNLTLNGQNVSPTISGLSESCIAAIAKAPQWIQRRLASQFQNLSDPQSYADVLLNASTQYADEIAFSIACCPVGKVPSASLLKANAEALYEQDQLISYADIVDQDDGMGNYSSTIRYRVLENGTETSFLLPPDIYYSYIVHPKITNEEIDAVYGPLWREYLFNHNDLGYPLLKEKLSTIQYLWDCQSYYQPGGRLWSVCINQHPTAIEAISYWVGKTVPNQATGDRPGQASVIAHEHNGWCGELQKIAVAAQRAALIPTISASNVGEDHVWREFYERGWHENDNWWSDTGGAVDEPDAYAYGWGKNMSAVYQWRGDGTILEDTARYIHEEDRITVDFTVKDLYLQPVDGARIIVLVKGPKDITFYKNLIWQKVQSIWDKLPEGLKGKLLTLLFEKIQGRIEKIPDSITGLTITIWNYTDSSGRCRFELGKNLEYLFFIQEGKLRKPWQLARHNTFRSLKTGMDKSFTVILMDASKKPQRMTRQEMTPGDCEFHVSIASNGYQLEKHFTTNGIGRHESQADIECFFVDSENFQRYKAGQSFTCYKYWTGNHEDFSVAAKNQDWYLVFRNTNRKTFALVDFAVDVSAQTTDDHVQIVTPDTSVFEHPIMNIGDSLLISGIATSEAITLLFDHGPGPVDCPVMNGEWSYLWDTSGEELGTYLITAAHEGVSDARVVILDDGQPPSLSIDTPVDGAILEQGMMSIAGHCSDNDAVDHIEVIVNNITKVASGTTTWGLSWNLTGLPLGDYVLSVHAFDSQGLVCIENRSIVLNESGHSWGPQVQSCSYTPLNLSNTSNVIILANVTSTGPFAIRSVLLYCSDGVETVSSEMYRYGDYPVQSRHEEDPLFNVSNAPCFGRELGQFSSGQTIGYWIVAVDTAGNRIQSEGDSFTIP